MPVDLLASSGGGVDLLAGLMSNPDKQKYDEYLGKDIASTGQNVGDALLGYGANVSQMIPFSDEAMSAVGAGFGAGNGASVSDRYNDLQIRQQALRDASLQTQPRIETPAYMPDITPAGVGEAGAVLATAGLAPGAEYIKGAKTLAGSVGRGSLVGAGYGTTYGAGQTDATLSTPDAIAERGINALGGGVTGAIVGGATPLAVRGGQKIAEKTGGAYKAMADYLRGAETEAAPSKATQILSDYALGMDQSSPQQLAATLRANKGQPITLADVTGPNAQTALEQATQTQGKSMADAVRFFNERNQQASTRLQGVIEDNVGSTDYVNHIKQLQDQMGSDTVGKAYQEAFDAGPRIGGDQVNKVLNSLDNSALADKVWANAARMAKADGVAFNSRVQGNAVRDLSTQELDYVKKAADDIISSMAGKTDANVTKSDLRFLTKWSNELRGAVDEVNPAYGVARATYGEPASAATAMEEGKNFLRSGDWSELVDRYGKANKNELEGFKSGIARDLLERLKAQGGESPLAGGANPARSVANDPAIRERLSEFLGPDQADKFIEGLTAQANMQDVGNKMIYNSSTARRVAASDDMNRRAMSMTEKLRNYGSQFDFGRPASWIGALGEKMSANNKASINEEIASLMTNPDYRENMQTIYQLSRAQALSEAEKKQMAAALRNVKEISPATTRLLLGTRDGK